MLRHIPVTDLKKGLYVVDLHQGRPLLPPLYSVEGYILSDEESAKLLRAGFKDAWIDDERTIVVFADSIPDAELVESADDHPWQTTVSYCDEYENAIRIYSRSLELAKEIHANIDARNDINLEATRELLTDMLASLTRNRSVLCSLAKLKEKDDYTFTHCVNVALFAVTLGKHLGVKDKYLVELGTAGFFHDIGKIFIPSSILNSPDRLTEEQFTAIRKHADLGYNYLKQYPNLSPLIREGTRDHHERHNGQGYPAQKREEEASLPGRLLAVVDVYDAISSKRCYKDAVSPPETLRIMYQTREQDFSPGFVEALIGVLGVYPSGSLVRLSNKYLAVVLEQNEIKPLCPKVVLLIDAFGTRLAHPRIVDLFVHRNLSILGPILNLPVNIDIRESIKYAR